MVDDRQRLGRTFNSAADRYQEARPEYPQQLFDALVEVAGLQPGDRLLEVGCATGKATLPLARRGYRITCIEIGPDLAAAARGNLADFPHVDVVESAFETWEPLAGDRFDIVFAATAWHWLDSAVRYQRAWRLLRPGGHLAIWSAVHVFPEGGDPFFAELQDVYDEIGESLPQDATRPRPGELPDDREEIERTGLFEDVIVRHFGWEVVYDADRYLLVARHILRAHRDGAVAARSTVRRDPPTARAARGRSVASPLGSGAAGGPSSGPGARPVNGTVHPGGGRDTPSAIRRSRVPGMGT